MSMIRFVPVGEITDPLTITLGLSGASGTGKTYSSLLIARGMAEAQTGTKGAPIGYVDTENRRALHYKADFPEMLHFDMQAVDEVLEEIGAGGKPRLLVLNKADLLDEDDRREVGLAHPEAVLVSAATGEGLDTLRERIEEAFEETLAEVELLVPYAQGARLHELHEVAGHLERTDREDGVLVHAKVPVAELHRFDDLAVV